MPVARAFSRDLALCYRCCIVVFGILSQMLCCSYDLFQMHLLAEQYTASNNSLGFKHIDYWTAVAPSTSSFKSICEERHLCIESAEDHGNYTWKLSTLFDKATACEMLVAHNKTMLHFFGDSFIRHTYISMSSILTGDYVRTSMNPDAPEGCTGESMYGEKFCRVHIGFATIACNGLVHLKYHSLRQFNPWCHDPSSTECNKESIVFWTEGNHPIYLREDLHETINNADVYYESRVRKNQFCTLTKKPLGLISSILTS